MGWKHSCKGVENYNKKLRMAHFTKECDFAIQRTHAISLMLTTVTDVLPNLNSSLNFMILHGPKFISYTLVIKQLSTQTLDQKEFTRLQSSCHYFENHLDGI